MSVFKKKRKDFTKTFVIVLGMVAVVYFGFGYRMTPERVFEAHHGHAIKLHDDSHRSTTEQVAVDEINSHIFIHRSHNPSPNPDEPCFVITVAVNDWIGWRIPAHGGRYTFCNSHEGNLGRAFSSVKVRGLEEDVHVAFGAGKDGATVTHSWSDGVETVLNDENDLFLRWIDEGITSSTVIEER